LNHNTIIFLDFETGSRNASKTQPIQLAAVAIHSRRLEIIEGSEFNSLIRPYSDEEAEKLGLDKIEDEALKVNGKTREEIEKAPSPKVVWGKFTDYVNSYNYKKNKWTAPVLAGFNNNGFDDIIIDRLCGREPYKFGPYDTTYCKQSLFHPIHNIDLMKMVFSWFENNQELKSFSMDNLRDYLGMSKDNAHDALQDVKDGANVLIRFLKLHRLYATKVRFKNAFAQKT
jgi:DNA polymerase-3 subunit epsilon